MRAAQIYGVLPALGAIIYPFYWFSLKKTSVDALSKNSMYKLAWLAVWLGHLSLYAFPALTWPVSMTARRGFNTIFVMWQQYVTYLTGLFLSLAISGLFALSYY